MWQEKARLNALPQHFSQGTWTNSGDVASSNSNLYREQAMQAQVAAQAEAQAQQDAQMREVVGQFMGAPYYKANPNTTGDDC